MTQHTAADVFFLRFFGFQMLPDSPGETEMILHPGRETGREVVRVRGGETTELAD